MKKNRFLKICIAHALCIMFITSCVHKLDFDIKSEVTVPSGAVNYFDENMEFGFQGGTKVMSFKCNIIWSIKVADTQNGVQWLTVNPEMGNGGNNKVTFYAEDNNTYEDRSVVVQFITADTTRTIKVNQKRMEAITLTSDIFEVPVDGGTIDIEVNYSTDYEVIIPDDYKSWIHQSTSDTRGLNSSKLNFTIDSSDEYEKREGRIYFRARDEEEVVTVYQAGSSKLVLSQNEYNLTGSEQEFSVDISSNFDFAMEMPDVDWLKENTSQTRGMSSHSLKFKVTENDNYNKTRSAKIKIYDVNSKLSETIVVNQASIGALISLDTLEYHVSSEKQDLNIEVKSNFDYNIDFQGANWVKQQKNETRGISSRLLRLTIDKNDSYDSRTANIRLYEKNGSASETITITQEAKKGIEIPTKVYTIDELGGILDIEINSNVDYKLTINDDWIKEPSNTRGLASYKNQLIIAALGDGEDRTGTVTVSNEDLNYSETITIKQRQTFYLEKDEVNILIGREYILPLTNLTDQSYVCSSSDTNVATVKSGVVKGVSKGRATITVQTDDGKHTAICVVNVCEITDMITVYSSGGVVSITDDLIQYESKLRWTFNNGSKEKVLLKSMQLIDGVTGIEGNEMTVNKEVAAETSVTYTTTIGIGGIHIPVKCRFTFEFDGKQYTMETVYDKSL